MLYLIKKTSPQFQEYTVICVKLSQIYSTYLHSLALSFQMGV